MIQHFYKVVKLLPQNAEICIRPEVLKTLAPVLTDEELEKICYDAAKDDSEAAKPTFNKRFLKMTSTIDFSTDNPQQSRPKINLLTDDA
ncbi:unnamed protein product [Orchesella dallaii]|uniref:Uncharacterized protein n=1 Tax=Orchesella dallaii TaxID=48710 RepID=A0ABP1RIP3_9HEXA